MSFLFVAAQFSKSAWDDLPFSQRLSLVRRHYILRPQSKNVVEREWFFPNAGLGIYVAYQKLQRMLFVHESRDGSKVDFISHAPFGYRSVTPETPLERAPSTLARAVARDPENLLRISPPQNIVTVDEALESFTLRNDLLGLAKSYLLDVPHGHAIANRPIAAHLLAAVKPELSSMGWAAQQLHGWFLSHLTPFKRTRGLRGGTVAKLDSSGFTEAHCLRVGKWFTEPPTKSMFDGFERYMAEFAEFVDPPELDVALSGGRDSRATAALFSHFHLDKVRFRTNEPPALEGIIARKLVEKLPNFARFERKCTVAVDAAERLIWKANTPKIAEIEVHSRARQWAYVGEGISNPAAIYGNPPVGPIFRNADEFMPTISGVAGECAKAYYWSPRMVSGAYARSPLAFKEDITNIKINDRIKTHPLTAQSDLPFIRSDYRQPLIGLIYDAQREATNLGIHGYRFLDYWWLTNRVGVASPFLGPEFLMPFLVPEYMAEALQRPPIERARGQALTHIVNHYRPEWAEVSYFDEVQNSVPREQLRAYRERSLLWEGDLAAAFFSILRDSPAFDDPYDRQEIIAYFKSDIDPAQKQVMNLKALGLAYRHSLWQFCEDVGKDIEYAFMSSL